MAIPGPRIEILGRRWPGDLGVLTTLHESVAVREYLIGITTGIPETVAPRHRDLPVAPPLLESMRQVTRHGLRIFPVTHTTKRPMGAGWQAAATSSPEVLVGWMQANRPGRRCRSYLVRTGVPMPDGRYLIGFDVDPRSGGRESLGRLLALHGLTPDDLPPTLTVRTGGHPEGRHYYYGSRVPWKGVSPIPGFPGLDLKADRGYLIGPGSLHDSGRTYELIRGFDEGVADLPEWLTSTLEGAGEKHEESARRDPGRRAGQAAGTPQDARWTPGVRPEAIRGDDVPDAPASGPQSPREAAPRATPARAACTRRADPAALAEEIDRRYPIEAIHTRHNVELRAIASLLGRG